MGRRLRNELNKIASDRERHQADAEKAGNEMNLMHSEIRKWQEKHTMAIQDLQMKDSALQRVEVELERTRNELDRSKLAIDKADGNKLIHEAQMDKLQKEIDSLREKQSIATKDVHEAECRYDQVETENARMRFQMQEVEAQRDKLMHTSKEFDRAEEKYKVEI